MSAHQILNERKADSLNQLASYRHLQKLVHQTRIGPLPANILVEASKNRNLSSLVVPHKPTLDPIKLAVNLFQPNKPFMIPEYSFDMVTPVNKNLIRALIRIV
jgi:hypothetical protein